MNLLRKLCLILITPLFTVLLFALAFDMGVLRVAGQPSGPKQILRESGVYNSAVNDLLGQAKQQTSEGDTVNLTNPIVKAAANQAFTPQYVQGQTENVIDSIYAWLNGKSAQPEFNVDLSSQKVKFAEAAGQAAEAEAKTLPACTDATRAGAAVNDPLSATCLPPGVTAAAVGSEVQDNLLTGKGFLDSANFNAGSIKSSNSSKGSTNKDTQQNIFQNQLKDAPKQFQRLKKTPIILAVLTLLTAVAIVFLSSNHRLGLRHIGWTLVVVGAVMLLMALAINHVITTELPKIDLGNAVVNKDVQKLAKGLSHQIINNYLIFGGVYVGLGVLMFGSAMFWKNGQKKEDLEGEGRTAADRIDLKAPDKPMTLGGDTETQLPAKPSAKKDS